MPGSEITRGDFKVFCTAGHGQGLGKKINPAGDRQQAQGKPNTLYRVSSTQATAFAL